ncbi:MAG: hypothetical protein KGH71_04150 [Candidatus Micrarchaeota archaeon]|nr:hypothetical protein [Candidatus Micrarchaeota archaeon]
MAFAKKDNSGFEYKIVENVSGQSHKLILFKPKLISEENLIKKSEDISLIFGSAFYNKEGSFQEWPPERVLRRIREISFGILVEKEGQKIGYAIFESPSCELGNILFINSIGFAKQGAGLGQLIMREAINLEKSRIVAGRTQNPNLIKMLRRLNPVSILPIDEDYSSSEQNRQILDALRDKTVELRNAVIDDNTGVCKKAYSKGKLGNYPVNLPDLETTKIQSRFNQIGLDQNGGDAVIVTAKLDFI